MPGTTDWRNPYWRLFLWFLKWGCVKEDLIFAVLLLASKFEPRRVRVPRKHSFAGTFLSGRGPGVSELIFVCVLCTLQYAGYCAGYQLLNYSSQHPPSVVHFEVPCEPCWVPIDKPWRVLGHTCHWFWKFHLKSANLIPEL